MVMVESDFILLYHMAHQTIVIFDWDDTLCPSTYCRTELSDEFGVSFLFGGKRCHQGEENYQGEENQGSPARGGSPRPSL